MANYEVRKAGSQTCGADNDILYLGDYAGGGRAVDISGELRGNLYEQGREIARFPGRPEWLSRESAVHMGRAACEWIDFFQRHQQRDLDRETGKPKFQGSTTAPPLRDAGPTAASPF